ncbi:MAG: LamG domain-containing protein [Candidatus Marinimicrobia bacterium]|nr:LamG domain-containing protein [Candidatus Neomarinimicrobiota bacterium]
MNINKYQSVSNKDGYTLIELLVYTAVFAAAVGVFSGVLITFTRVGTQTSADAELTQQLSFIQDTIQRFVRESANIENPAGVASSTLILRMASPASDPTIISSDENGIYLKQGTGETLAITNNQVKVSEFEATKYENPGGHATVRINLALTYNSESPYQKITRALKFAIGRVSAATFDDSLVPNTDNSFSLGIASTNRWKDINISNLLNLGQLITDPVAGAQNGSIYYNTASSSFRGYANGVWANLGGVGWEAAGNDIYNTNSGNVGIGINPPLYTLDVTGTFRATGTSTFSGNVGIGTTNPTYKLQVNGSVGLGNVIYTLASTAQGGIDAYTKLMLHADGSDQGTTFTDSETTPKTVTNTESYDSYNKLMLHMNGSDGGTTFTDSATSKSVTRNGDTSISQVNASGLFDGTGDYLSLTDSADWNFGTGDFTIDFWIKFNSISSPNDQIIINQRVNSNNTWWVYKNNTNNISVVFYIGGVAKGSYSTPLWSTPTDWHHFAFIRNGTTGEIFIDGVSSGTENTAFGINDVGDLAADLVIGAEGAGAPDSFYFNGWLDEVRISKGIARWTANFTPSATPYTTADSYTKLLLHMNHRDGSTTFTDSETTPKTVTANGNAQIDTAQYKFTEQKFSQGGFFDGNGDYLSLADSDDWNFGSGDFTIDAWVKVDNYLANTPSGNPYVIYSQHVDASNFIRFSASGGAGGQLEVLIKSTGQTTISFSSSVAIGTGAWHHAALVRSGNTVYLFIDGVQRGTADATGVTIANFAANAEIGAQSPYTYYMAGWLDEVRVSKGIARWTSNFNVPPYSYGQVQTSTSQKEFGTASGFFDGAGSYLSVADSTDWDFGTGDFTIDFWVRWNSAPGMTLFFEQSTDNANNLWALWYQSSLSTLWFTASVGGTNTALYYKSSTSFSENTWYHIAFMRSGSNAYFAIDGAVTQATEAQSWGTLPTLASPLYIGYSPRYGGIYYMNGWLDEARFSKGIARWTSNFTPPSAPYDSQTPGANNVGIGTVSPNYMLDVNGDVNVTGNITLTGDIYTDDWTDYASQSTIVGWSSFTTKNIWVKKVGKTVFWMATISGTSNSASTSFTLPYTNLISMGSFIYMGTDNSVDVFVLGGPASGSNSVSCYKGTAFNNFGAWTTSGTKSIQMSGFYETE